MRRRRDIAALNLGLLFILLGALGLWMSFGTVNWSLIQIAAPLSLVVLGVLGLALSRKS